MKNVTALVGMGLIASSAIAGSPNLLLNPSFEDVLSPLMGGGFEEWDRFGNIFEDVSAEVAAFDQMTSVKSFGGFFGPGVQSDQGAFQSVAMPDAGGKTFEASVWAYTPAGDPIEPLNFDEPNGNFGHLPLLLLQFQNDAGDTLSQPEVRVFDPEVDPADTWVFSSVEGVAPAGTTQITVFCLLIQFGDNPGALFWDLASLVEIEVSAGCNDADLAMPFDTLDLSDINAFVSAFTTQDPAGDLDDSGNFDLTDINLFVSAFVAGCP